VKKPRYNRRMTRTHTTDSAVIAAPPKRVFAVLLAVGRYADWWPAALAPRIVSVPHLGAGSTIEAGPRFGRFQARITEAEPPQRVSVAYVGGAHRGTGEWRLEPADGGTRVTYSIDLAPHGLVARALSRLVDFGPVHSRMMAAIFEGLAREAARR
jgi:uncharacterized protein YndB with AHSA1/START domain